MTVPPIIPPAWAAAPRPAPARVSDEPAPRWPALLVAAVACVAVAGIWAVFVVGRTGRLVDRAAFDGAELGRNRLWQLAEPVLEIISVPFITGVLVVTMLLAVLRRRTLLALQVAVLMGGANLTTQLLKHVVLERPDMGLEDSWGNTLPSGHTTAAASVAAALVFVVPRRARPAAAVIGALYTAATGVSTLVGRWHRPSDAVAAVLVVLAWAALASALRSREARDRRQEHRAEAAVVAWILLLTGAIAAVGAGLALHRSVVEVGSGLESTAQLLTAYGGGALGVVALSFGAFGVLLLLPASGRAQAR